ncbi:bifunctional folylpolyglutamate synthase/dihydrofolate synthase [bacterium]|nr:bifunctional folylpolyglutamate synthase/dihydrofolate synthase [bacterium]
MQSQIKLGLENISKAVSLFNNPQNKFKSIHVAGTNGKGSVCTMIASILSYAGYKVGLYTSPHLVDECERIVVYEGRGTRDEGRKINRLDFDRYYAEVEFRIKEHGIDLTYFEILTLMAFLYFRDQKVDWAVVETGLGGRLDATNIIKDKIAVITNVGFDHKEFLGETLDDIAKEKFGIVWPGNLVVTAAQCHCEEPSGDVAIYLSLDLHAHCRSLAMTPWNKHPDISILKKEMFSNIEIKQDGVYFNFKDISIFIPTLAEYQVENAGLAILTIKTHFPEIKDEIIKEALANFYWPGRMEKVEYNGKTIILEGAHNAEGSLFLKKILERDKDVLLVLGILKDKPYEEMIKNWAPYAKKILVTSSYFEERAVSSDVLKKECEKFCKDVEIVEDAKDVLAKIVKTELNKIYVAGSLYLVGKVKEALI